MKKKDRPLSRSFSIPKLYLDDIEDIENIITKELKPKKYLLETNDYEYRNVEEVIINKDALEKLHIRSFSPYLSLNIDERDTRLYIEGDDLRHIGIFKKISDIISKRERVAVKHFANYSLWAFFITIFISIQIMLYATQSNTSKQLNLIAAALIMLAIFLISTSFYLEFKIKSIIILKKEKENIKFLTKNKDQVIMLIIGAITTAIFGIITAIVLKFI